MNRHEARIKAIQALYQIDLVKKDSEEAIEYVLSHDDQGNELENIDKQDGEFLKQLVLGVTENQAVLDEKIASATEKWSLDRFGKVDLAIVRLATYEMMHEEGIPLNVTFNEAIELAKAFSDENSRRFVNGVLSKVKATF